MIQRKITIQQQNQVFLVMNIKKKLREIYRIVTGIYGQVSFAQDGEDLLIDRIFSDVNDGFYVDVGAHHPIRFSNTYRFYKKGWSGINIDPCPGTQQLFDFVRPRDINIEVGVATEPGSLTYYMFNEPALNGFSSDLSETRNTGRYKIENTKIIKVLPLREILKEHVPPGKKINFMSVDVEGLDLEVLRSNDWTLYRPQVVVAEILESSLENLSQSELYQFLTSLGYTAHAKTTNTVLFRSREVKV